MIVSFWLCSNYGAHAFFGVRASSVFAMYRPYDLSLGKHSPGGLQNCQCAKACFERCRLYRDPGREGSKYGGLGI